MIKLFSLLYNSLIILCTSYGTQLYGSHVLSLQLQLDDYPEETTWQFTAEDGTSLFNGGPYNNPDQIAAFLTIPLPVNDGCYIFTINDSSLDGICCQYGNGSYTIIDGNNNVLATGGEFFDKEIKTICINASNVDIDGEWKTLKTGAGGWLTGMNIHPSGNPIYTRSDVGGAYRFDPNSETWKQIVTTESMPLEDIYWNTYSGVLSIVSAPSDNNIAYMAYKDGIYTSYNQGENWEKTNFPTTEIRPNDQDSKLGGERLAVDPQNADVVYFGSIESGLWTTANGGNSWTQISSVPSGGVGRGIRSVHFDKSKGSLAGKTKTIFTVIDSSGIFMSSDAGSTWTDVSPNTYWQSGNPTFFDSEVAPISGGLYICGQDYDAQNDIVNPFGVLVFDGTNWNQVFNDSDAIGEIAIDPFNEDRVFLFGEGIISVYRTQNISAQNPTWTFLNYDIEAENIPWLAWLDNDYFSLGEISFDPVVEDKIWISHGTGSYTSTDLNGSSFIWEEESVGQEHLVSNDIVSLSNGNVVTAHWDFPMFLHSDLDDYPEVMKPINRFNAAWDIDQSPTDENFLVAIVEDERYCCFGDGLARSSSYSEDGGDTWTRFPSMPEDDFTLLFGLIAVSANDNNNWIWLASNQRMPYVTLDKGVTWTQINLPGASTACCLTEYFFKRRSLTADRVLANTFYIYDWGDGSIFKSSDGGLTWTKSATNVVKPASYNAKLISVPNKPEHLLFAPGPEQAVSLVTGLAMSEDGGETWTEFTNTNEILNVAVGKQDENGTYPTLFINGKVNGDYGFFKSIDKGISWEKLPSYPLGYYDTPTVMEGDMNVNGRLYVGFPGNGFVYFSENSSREAPHLVIDNNTIELLPNPNESYFRIEGVMSNFTLELLDGNENIIEDFGSPPGALIIEDSSLTGTTRLLRVTHQSKSRLFFQTKLK